jgi:hypothetical protein
MQFRPESVRKILPNPQRGRQTTFDRDRRPLYADSSNKAFCSPRIREEDEIAGEAACVVTPKRLPESHAS